MDVTNYFLIGKVTIPSSWIAVLVGFFFAYFAIRFKYKKQIAEIVLDGFFYFILTWKFSVIFTQFTTVIKAPITILYFNGGKTGIILGLAIAFLHVYRAAKKANIEAAERVAIFISVVIALTGYQVMMALLNSGSLLAKGITIVSFLLFAMFTWLTAHKNMEAPKQLAILLLAVHFFVAAFQPNGVMHISIVATILISSLFVIWMSKLQTQMEEKL